MAVSRTVACSCGRSRFYTVPGSGLRSTSSAWPSGSDTAAASVRSLKRDSPSSAIVLRFGCGDRRTSSIS
jgi:hypothetical protein